MSNPRRTPAGWRPGFTVTELVVVIAVIATIVAITVPTIGKIRKQARTAACLTNQRQIAQACYAYGTANAGRWPSSRTDEGGVSYPSGEAVRHPWVRATAANTTGTYERTTAITTGVLFPYIGSIPVYISPDEPSNPSAGAVSGERTRIRSYSLNACLGVSRPDEWTDYDQGFRFPLAGTTNGSLEVDLTAYNTTTMGVVKQPSRMMCTIVEDDNIAWNNQGWIINPQFQSRLWVDLPAPWRPDAITITYVDGSTDSRAMANPKICDLNYGAPFPTGFTVLGPGPHNARAPLAAGAMTDFDWKWFRDRLNPGVLPGIPGLPAISD
jgi:prepilin-type N-terminal cleavage/methylation domain-containing protein